MKLLKEIAGSLFTLSFPVVAWFAVNGNVGCGRIILFTAIMLLSLSPLALLASFIKVEPRPMWAQVQSHVSDALVVSILVWHGWLFSAFGFAISWLACVIMFRAGNNQAKEKK